MLTSIQIYSPEKTKGSNRNKKHNSLQCLVISPRSAVSRVGVKKIEEQ